MAAQPARSDGGVAPQGCPPGDEYVAVSQSDVWQATSLASAWQDGGPAGATISYTDSGSWSVGVTISASISVSASAIIASSEATFGVDLTASYSHSESWSHSLNVPAGQTWRLVRTHKAKKISFKLYRDTSGCTTSIYTGYIIASIVNWSSTSYCWKGDKSPATSWWTPDSSGGCSAGS